MSNMWGLPQITKSELNNYAFPDLAAIVGQMDIYIAGLKGKPKWPALSKTLKLRKEVTQPGMMFILGNPEAKNGQIVSAIMNNELPGVSYQLIHKQFKGSDEFVWTDQAKADEFFKKIGAINVMPDDSTYAGNPPATPLPDGGILVNAHSKCATGLMVHEIFHAYGGPAGMFGEGLTDWFSLDFMKDWKKSYDGNPAYTYNVSVVNQLVAIAGKERVARMVFLPGPELAALKGKGDKPTQSGKIIKNATMSGSDVLSWQARATELALESQKHTMIDAGLEDKMATMVPLHATQAHEQKFGLPGAVANLATVLKCLLPD